jgi:hypothetical protein
VAWTGKNVLLRTKKYRASVVGAKAAESEIRVLRRPKQKAGPVVDRVRENHGSANRNFPSSSDYLYRVGGLTFSPIKHEGAQSTCGEAETQPLNKSAASNARILGWLLQGAVQFTVTFI